MFRRTKTKLEKKDESPTDDDNQKTAKNELTAGFGKFLGKKKNSESAESQNSEKTESSSTEKKTESSQISEKSKDKVSSLIRLIKSSNEKVIAPKLELSTGVFTYPQLSEIGEDPNNIEFLENLTTDSSDLLEKTVYERIAVCPQHPESLEVNVRLYCPKCSSMDIEKLHLFEHRICGYISETKNFGQNNSMLECPSCKKPIKDRKKELRIPAMWYNCHSCQDKFDDVVIKMYCRKHNHDFDTNMAGTVSIPGFALKDSQSTSGQHSSLLSNIKELLQENKFVSEEDCSLKGKSGHYHNIDLIATNPNTDTIFLYLLDSENETSESEINSRIIQVLDCNPTKTIIIGKLASKAKSLASRYDISVIDSTEKNEILSSFANILNETFTIEQPQTQSSQTESVNYLEDETSEDDHNLDSKLLEENVAKAAELELENAKLKQRLEEEKLAERKKLEEERLESERIEAERLEAELLAEKQRLEKEMQANKQKLEGELQADKQKLEKERQRLEEERRDAERLEAERLAERKRLEEERKKVERIEAERLAERKKLESEILTERKRLEEERLAAKKKLEEEKFADQLRLKAEHQRLEQERKKVEKLESERQRLEEERKMAEQLAAEKLEAEEKRKEEDKKQAEKRARILKKLEETENQLRSLKSSFDNDSEKEE